MRTLKLTLKRLPFDVMITGEKCEEFRLDSAWIRARLFDKEGRPRHYDIIEYVNGYGASRPRFLTDFKGFELVGSVDRIYSNGLHVVTNSSTFVIRHSQVLSKSNITETLE